MEDFKKATIYDDDQPYTTWSGGTYTSAMPEAVMLSLDELSKLAGSIPKRKRVIVIVTSQVIDECIKRNECEMTQVPDSFGLFSMQPMNGIEVMEANSGGERTLCKLESWLRYNDNEIDFLICDGEYWWTENDKRAYGNGIFPMFTFDPKIAGNKCMKKF